MFQITPWHFNKSRPVIWYAQADLKWRQASCQNSKTQIQKDTMQLATRHTGTNTDVTPCGYHKTHWNRWEEWSSMGYQQLDINVLCQDCESILQHRWKETYIKLHTSNHTPQITCLNFHTPTHPPAFPQLIPTHSPNPSQLTQQWQNQCGDKKKK